MNASKIDVPVLLIFFNRPETFCKVFEQVKLARPSKLFLYQDGARKNRPTDVERVALFNFARNNLLDLKGSRYPR